MLSLEAPLVAVLWLVALARLDGFAIMPGVLPGLAAAVWGIYILDRLLDSWPLPADRLDVRHQFYRRWRWPLALVVLPATAAYVIWLSLWVVPAGLLYYSVIQLIPIGLYLLLYSLSSAIWRRRLLLGCLFLLLLFFNALPLSFELRVIVSLLVAGGGLTLLSLNVHEGVSRMFRKETAAGLLFAVGCTTWTRFLSMGSSWQPVWGELLILALLFIANLMLISAQEMQHARGQKGPLACATVTGGILALLGAAVAIWQGHLPATLMPLALGALAGLAGLEVLRRKGSRLSPEAFRVWADLAVALPPVGLLLWLAS